MPAAAQLLNGASHHCVFGNALIRPGGNPLIRKCIVALTFSLALAGPAAAQTAFIAGISPSALSRGSNAVAVQLVGIATHWDSTTQVSFGPGISFGSPAWTVNSSTSITALINVARGAPAGPQPVIVETGGQTLVDTINVLATPPISALGANAWQGAAFSTGLLSQFGNFVSGVTSIDFGSGVNVTGVNVTSPSAITITGSVDPLAFVGTRNITVTTGSQVQVLSNAFSVSAGPAAIALLNPNSGNQGQTLSIAITGSNTHFAQNTTTASFGQGISVNSLMVNSPISAIASITIAANATPQLNLVTLTTLGEITTPAAFNVTGAATISSINPTSLAPGQTATIAIAGSGTHWVNGNTVASFGAGVTVNSTTIIAANSGTASVTVSATATPGTRTVQMTTNTGGGTQEVASAANAFSVTTASATIVSATPTAPSTVHQNDTGTTPSWLQVPVRTSTRPAS